MTHAGYYPQALPERTGASAIRSLVVFWACLGIVAMAFYAYRTGLAQPMAHRVAAATEIRAREVYALARLDPEVSRAVLTRTLPAPRPGVEAPDAGASIPGGSPSFASIERFVIRLLGVGTRSPSHILAGQLPARNVSASAAAVDSDAGTTTSGLVALPAAITVPASPVASQGVSGKATETAAKPATATGSSTAAPAAKVPPPTTASTRVTVVPGARPSPTVLVYHTHTSETYSDQGCAYLWQKNKPTAKTGYIWGELPGVVTVGTALCESLEALGVTAVHSKQVNDYPSFTDAYRVALPVVEALLKAYPKPAMVIDLHRDGLTKGEGERTVLVNHAQVAPVFIVVTTDKFGLPHPKWRLNYAFALSLQRAIDSSYPGLCRGVNLRDDARWNQHVDPHAVLIEVGSNLNTTEEAAATARLLAVPIANVVKAGSAQPAGAAR